MIRFLGQRILVLLMRLFLVAVLLLLVMELSFGVLGGSDAHVWEMSFADPVLPTMVLSGDDEWTAILPAMKNSFVVVGMAWGAVMLVGYAWGILSVRLSRFQGKALLIMPWFVLACVPGFWWVIQVAIYSYFTWERPGFANEVVVESGPDVMQWWNAVVVALPLSVVGIASQLAAVNGRIQEEVGLPFVQGLFQAGYSEGEIFYKNVLRRLAGEMVNLADRTLPLIFGGLVLVEAAFRYEGMGNFLLRSLQMSFFPGIFVAGMWMAAVIGIVALIREGIVHAMGSD